MKITKKQKLINKTKKLICRYKKNEKIHSDELNEVYPDITGKRFNDYNCGSCVKKAFKTLYNFLEVNGIKEDFMIQMNDDCNCKKKRKVRKPKSEVKHYMEEDSKDSGENINGSMTSTSVTSIDFDSLNS
jgi:hypothetical protein